MSKYYHFVGGKYDSKARFINEALAIGWSRNCPIMTALGFHFGDTLVFVQLRRDKSVIAIGEGRIDKITFKDPRVAALVGNRLLEKGQASYSPAPLSIQRECGSYLQTGFFDITDPDLDISDLAKMALKIAADGNYATSCMIGGKISKVYPHPVILQPAPKFTRGFIRIGEDETYEPVMERSMMTIENYRKK